MLKLFERRALVAKVGPEKREVDIRLSQTKNLAAQLTSAEWLMSIPGTPGQKEQLFEGRDLAVHAAEERGRVGRDGTNSGRGEAGAHAV